VLGHPPEIALEVLRDRERTKLEIRPRPARAAA